MPTFKIRLLRAAALSLALPAAPLFAQGVPGEIVQQINPEAERLSEDMKLLAADPRNVTALVSAGRGALAMGDPNGALSFFLRAQDVMPTHGPAKAGIASALVELERPGEALRLFEEATRYGVPEADIAADRGLAYDLVGDQARAQRDYAIALARRGDDEVTRRYALSLGISNQKEQALAMLDPLIRKQDRGAWRARAFILAMTGDETGAMKIAEQTLPRGMPQMLRPYFDKLEGLNGGERAFAVHYGHLGGDAARLARQAAPVASGPVIATASAPPPAPAPTPTQLASAPQRQPTRAERRAAERAARNTSTRVASAPTPTQSGTRTPIPAPTPPVQTAAATVAPAPTPAPTPVARTAAAAPTPAPRTVTPAPTPTPTPVSTPARTAAASAPVPTAITAVPGQRAPVPTRVASSYGPPASATAAPQAISAVPAASPTPSPAPAVAAMPAPTPPAAAAPVRVASAPAVRPDLLASIIAGVAIPQSELAARPAASLDEVARVQAEERRAARAQRAREEAAAKKAADAKALADAAAAKKKADAAAAAAAAAKKAAPERHWVQIATGSNPAALARDFKKMAANAPVLKGQSAWSARFGGTRRMLVGPFASQREAVAFMSKAKAAGIGGFNWTSPEGAEVEKLPGA